MVAYNIAGEFAGAARRGVKTLTLHEPRETDPRHAHVPVGGRVQVTTWNTCTKARSQLFDRPCNLRAHVVLGPQGVVRVTDIKLDGSDAAGSLSMMLAAAEQGSPAAERWSDALAVRDGFENYAAMYAWHAANGARHKPDADGRVRRELISWVSA